MGDVRSGSPSFLRRRCARYRLDNRAYNRAKCKCHAYRPSPRVVDVEALRRLFNLGAIRADGRLRIPRYRWESGNLVFAIVHARAGYGPDDDALGRAHVAGSFQSRSRGWLLHASTYKPSDHPITSTDAIARSNSHEIRSGSLSNDSIGGKRHDKRSPSSDVRFRSCLYVKCSAFDELRRSFKSRGQRVRCSP